MRVQKPCPDEVCTEDWHYMPLGTIVKPRTDKRLGLSDNWETILRPEIAVDVLLGDEITRLVLSGLVSIRYRACTASIFFRVYIGAAAHIRISLSNKTKDGKSLRACWNVLLGLVSRRLSDWYAGEGDNRNVSWRFASDERSLSEIFTELTPPLPRESFLETIKDIDSLLNLPLYSFQRTTVAAMLEREVATAMRPDPTFVPLHSFDSNSAHHTFWIQPSTMQVVTEPPFYSTAESGGILSEEMGAGKTVILLALILATRGKISRPDKTTRDLLMGPDGIEGSEVLTALSLRTFQTQYHHQLRETYSLPSNDRLPTLAEVALHLLSVNPQAVLGASPKVRGRFELSSLAEILPRIRPFFLESSTSGRGVIKTDKRTLHSLPVYLSHSTLVIVPSSLFEQWKGEFYKFCGDGNLNALFINDTKAKVPRAKDLVAFDLVLTTMECLSASNRKSSIVGHVALCRCPGDPLSLNVPLCTCTEAVNINPIFLCRWRRLVVDEGHTSANLTTEYTVAASKLSVEHRWLVTGTPTRNLIGSIATTRSNEGDDADPTGNALEDEKDMQRLAKMIGPYLRVEPFFTQRKYFEDHVSLPLRRGWKGAKSVLEAVLQQNMIRHPIEVVEAEVRLPSMTKETVLLRLESMQVRTYNLIQSTIVTNAVDSERKDEDYIFHPKNAKFLQATYVNLSQSLFWHADAEFFDRDLENHLRNSTGSIGRAIERGKVTLQDLVLLKRANNIQREAAEDSIWRKTMQREDVPYLTDGIGDDIQGVFSRYGAGTSLFHPDRLLKLRDSVCANVNIEIPELLQMGEKMEQEDAIKESFIQLQKAQPSKGGLAKKSHKVVANQRAGQIKARTVARQQGSCSLFGASVVSSSSSKLNYAIQEILKYGGEEKFLVFSSSLLSLMHLAEGLQLANIAFLEYTSECSPIQRRVNISQFNNILMYRVFLMELKHGARGLNLVAASRILFLEPAWAPDVEAQAIKRVHRTGQTRSVVVKTMAIRDTVEQAMLERRAAIVSKSTKMPALTEEAGMRSYIERPSFLEESGNDIAWSLPLVPVRKIQPPQRSMREKDTEGMDLCSNDANPQPQHKRGRSLDSMITPIKRVRFASSGDEMELCDRPSVRFVSPPAQMELCDDAPESLESGDSVR